MKLNKKMLKLLLFFSLAVLAVATIAFAQSVLDVQSFFSAPNWDGDSSDATFTGGWTDNPHSGPTCIQIAYFPSENAPSGFVDFYWLYPASNWGDERGFDLSKYTELVFYARGETGSEKVEFGMGGIGPAKPAALITVNNLSPTEWKMYTIDLSQQEGMDNVISGFNCSIKKKENPNGCKVYLDDITYQ